MWEGVARFVHTAPVPHLTPGLVRHIVLDLLLPPLVALLRAWCVPFLSGGSSRYGRVYSSTLAARACRLVIVHVWMRCPHLGALLSRVWCAVWRPARYRSPVPGLQEPCRRLTMQRHNLIGNQI